MVVGLTGFSGAGKSSVAKIFAEHGFFIIDCDQIVHQEVYYDPAVVSAIAKTFGSDTVSKGTIDRGILREKVMGDPEHLKKLNQTVLPFIIRHIRNILKNHQDQPVLLDAPLLFESGLNNDCDYTIAVVADPELSKERIMQRDHLTEEQAQRRISSQPSAAYYTEKCTYTLTNNEGISDLQQQTRNLIATIYE